MAKESTKGGRARRRRGAETRESGGLALTGASGFIGSRILGRLVESADDRPILVIDNQKPPVEHRRIRFFRVDFTEPTADATLAAILKKEECDTFIHTAYLSNPTHDQAYAHELEAIGTMHVLHASGEAGIRKLIVAGTTMSYGALPSNPNFLTEEHPLRASSRVASLRDRVEAEQEVARFSRKNPDTVVTLLRSCWIMGPTVSGFVTTFFSRSMVPTLLGYDPLLQFVHEEDAVDAFERAVMHDFRGAYNIVGSGVLPLSTLLKLAGKPSIPILHIAAYPFAEALWMSQLSEAPGPYLDYLRYLWVADGDKARIEMGFEP